ncbi:hypothetical protein [Ekhidna sp.]|uniref:hypothetical protein n=1 Tax=Ekhidna sp. TaxID=2608089 RepID=UPI003B59A084
MSIAEEIFQDHSIIPTHTRFKVIEYLINKPTACSLKELNKLWQQQPYKKSR